MKLTARDRKILAVIGVLGVVLGYWFLILGPKRDAVAKASETLAQAEERRDAAEAKLAAARSAEGGYSADYAAVVRLGKAIPATVDMPSLLVQLDSAAKGTGIDFDSISSGERANAASAPTGSPAPAAPGGSAAPGGTPAATAPGGAAENAGAGVNKANQPAAGNEQPAEGVSPSDAKTSEPTRQGGLPVGGGNPGGVPQGSTGSGAAGLDSVPLEFSFKGSYFDLADFFHRLKRFVFVKGDAVRVRGRLMTIDSLKFSSGSFPELSADVKATIYLSPKQQGVTAGATPAAPAQGAPQPASGAQPAPPAPVAAATPAGGAR